MDGIEENEQQYTSGFNKGYLLARHEPELAAKLVAKPNEHNSYFKGLISGREQYEKEAKELTKVFSRGGASRGQERNKGFERER